jgi:hypothetical protein
VLGEQRDGFIDRRRCVVVERCGFHSGILGRPDAAEGRSLSIARYGDTT